MSQIVVVIIAVVVAVGAFFYTRSVKADASSATVTFLQALGAGILGLGILLIAMPWAAGAIAAMDFISSSDFAILSGSVYAIGILALLGGIVLMVSRSNSSTEG